jgi:hypothetical protein
MTDPSNWLIILFIVGLIFCLLAIGPLIAWLWVFAWALFTSGY